MKNNATKYLGKKYITNEGYEILITEYKNNLNVLVKFLDTKNICKTRLEHIFSGKIKNVNHKSVHGVGFIGVGKHKAIKENKKNYTYSVWADLIKRCYSEKEKQLTYYNKVIVCEKWHNFQNFAEWFEENYIKGFELDKDILIKGNKIYSPETCCFVPHEINTLFVKSDKIRGEFPIGVTYNKKNKNFTSQIKIGNKKRKYIGSFKTPEDAFLAYKKEKELLIKNRSEKYISIIKENVYKALINYQVEITD